MQSKRVLVSTAMRFPIGCPPRDEEERRLSSAYYDLNPLEDLLEYLIDTKHIPGMPYEGIARHVIAFGEESLSRAERQLFEKEIAPLVEVDCVSCHHRMGTDELHEAYEVEVIVGLIYCRGCRP
jgi:hypothetical protein